MTTQIVRIGNTLTVEIPEEAIAQTDLRVGEPVAWVPNGNGGIELVRPPIPRSSIPVEEMTLEELMEGVEDGASLGEYDWGPPRGAEVW